MSKSVVDRKDILVIFECEPESDGSWRVLDVFGDDGGVTYAVGDPGVYAFNTTDDYFSLGADGIIQELYDEFLQDVVYSINIEFRYAGECIASGFRRYIKTESD